MQNKGIILSLADVQALRKAGFTPKGTLLEGTPQGFQEGGLASSTSTGRVIERGGQYFIVDDSNNYSQPYETALDAYYANQGLSVNQATGKEITPYGTPTTGTGTDGTTGTAGFTNNSGTTGTGSTRTGTTGTTGTPSWVTPPPPGSIVTQAVELLTNPITGETYMAPTGGYTVNVTKESEGTTDTTTGTDGTTGDEEATTELTQRERLLGAEGLKAYNEAQARLAGEVTTSGTPGPVAPTFTAPTPESIMAGVTEPTQPTFEDVDGTQVQQAVAQQVTAPTKPDLAKAEAVLSSEEVKNYLAEVRAAQGEIAANNLVTAAIQDPATLSQLSLDAAQIAEARRVEDVGRREVEAGEMISGPAVEQERVEELTSKIKAEEAQPSELATIQGQLAKLTADFDVKNPPAWAAGALRNATAQLAARGLGASSMAGQAIIQATFEAATPIAAADAATVAQFEQMNLSNRQQATMLAAQQRAAFLGQEFDQAFQTKVANAAKITEIANLNFNADVQIALENARLAQSVDIANLNAANAKVLSDAAAMSNMELANLNNRQQTAVANARAFLDMDLANLNNEQQTTVLKAQQVVSSMLSDQAARNAAINLNTANENELNRFFAQLESNTAQFNAAQNNAIAQSNVSEVNAMVKFKQEQKNALKIAYDRNQTAISQSRISANASIESTRISAEASVFAAETSAAATRAAAELRAEADRDIAAAANEARITTLEMEQAFQLESDILAYNYDTMASNAEKAFELVKLDLAGQIELEAAQYEIDAADDAATKKAVTDIAVGLIDALNPI